MQTVHIFVQDVVGQPGQKFYWTEAEQSFVLRFISRDELRSMFGGYYRAHERGLWRFLFGRRLLGVYGERKGSRFRQLLRERGATFEIVHDQERQSIWTSLVKEERPVQHPSAAPSQTTGTAQH